MERDPNEVDYGNQLKGLIPGATVELPVAKESLNGRTGADIDVSAVFEDGSSVGSEPLVSYLRGLTTGGGVELGRIQALYEGQVAPARLSADIAELRRGIGQPPTSETEALNALRSVGARVPSAAKMRQEVPDFLDGFVHGVNSRRQEALQKVEELSHRLAAAHAGRGRASEADVLREMHSQYRSMAMRYGHFINLARGGEYR